MKSGMSYGNESMESDLGYGEDDSDYGLGYVEPSGGEDGEMLVSSTCVICDNARIHAGPMVEPYEGQEFDGDEEAWTFYNTYARRAGFTTRISVYHRSRRDGSITSRQFVCAKEGFRTPRGKKDAEREKVKCLRAITRVGCKAMIRVRKQDNGKWVVSKFQKMHNHELVVPSRVHCLRSHRLLSESAKSVNGQCEGSQGTGNLSEFREEDHRAGNVGYTGQEHVSYSGVDHRSTIGRETRYILEYFKRMRAKDRSFFYAVQFNEDRCAGNVFWADSRSRMAYKYFKDVVVFDTSYKTSQYQMPFAFFAGVNHHQQPVLFGCALLVDDSESSLVWLFKTLLVAMSDSKPVSIVSDHDRAIQAAVVQVFPGTSYRFCRWHMLKESQDKLSQVYRSYPSFQGALQKCISASETTEEFESCWRVLIARYNLTDNEWLQYVYNFRHQWIPVYLRSTFFADVFSTQRCESRSAYFEGFINPQTTSQMLFKQYEKALESRHEREVKADFDTIYTLPVVKTPAPMEKQAAELYTRKIFKKFQEEFIETFVYTANKVGEEGDNSTYKVVKFEEHKSYTVRFNATEAKAVCSCQMFEHSGIPCRHILIVFSVTGVHTLPSHYILKRWSRYAKNDEKKGSSSGAMMNEANSEARDDSQDSQESLSWRYHSLCHEAIKYAEDGAASIEIYNVAVRALQEAAKKVTALKKNIGNDGKQSNLVNRTILGKHTNSAQENVDVREKTIQDIMISNSQPCDHMIPAPLQQQGQSADGGARPTMGSQDAPLFQQPLNIVFVSPGMPSDSATSSTSTAATSRTLNISKDQALSSPFNGLQLVGFPQGENITSQVSFRNQLFTSKPAVLNGKGQMLLSLPSKSIQMGASENEAGSQKGNASEICHADSNTGGSGITTTSVPTEAQLVAVPLTLYVPIVGNKPAACEASVNSSTSGNYPAIWAYPMEFAIASSPDSSTASTTSSCFQADLRNHYILQMPANGPLNPIHATAFASGGCMIPCGTTAPSSKTISTRSAIVPKSGEPSSGKLPVSQQMQPTNLRDPTAKVSSLPVTSQSSLDESPIGN